MKRTLKRESKVLEIAGIEGMATSIGGGGSWDREAVRGRVGRIGASLPADSCRVRQRVSVARARGQDGFLLVDKGRGKVAGSATARILQTVGLCTDWDRGSGTGRRLRVADRTGRLVRDRGSRPMDGGRAVSVRAVRCGSGDQSGS